MNHAYAWPLRGLPARSATFFTYLARAGAAALLLALLPLAAQAQATAPAWELALSGNNNQPSMGTSSARASAVDASGNVFVTGSFSGSVTFGTTRLTGTGTGTVTDVFIAKWDATARAWAWAVAGGGGGNDQGSGIAVSGSEVYVTGFVNNNGTANATTMAAVQFGGAPLYSASTTISLNTDVFVAHYTDGPTPTYRWAVAAGGTGNDQSNGIAVSGSEVYVTGFVSNGGTRNATTTTGVQFGGTPLYSASTNSTNSDVFVARYTDGLTAPTCRWAVAAGGIDADIGYGIAVSGSDIYLTGTVANSGTANATTNLAVQFGGAPLYSASTNASLNVDVFVARYTTGTTAPTYRWAVAGGGTGQDYGYGIAVSGSEIYVTGQVANGGTANATTTTGAQFGGTPLFSASTNSTPNADVFVVRYTDGTAPTYRWAVAGGGTGGDVGYGLAVSGQQVYLAQTNGTTIGRYGSVLAPPTAAVLGQLGTATGSWQRAELPLQGGTSQTMATAVNASGNVFVTGMFTGQVAFGVTQLLSAGGPDMFVAKWDATAQAFTWATSGGGTTFDQGNGIAVSGTSVYVTGYFTSNTSATIAGQALAGAGGADMFVAKYIDTSTGTTPATSSYANGWATSGGGTSSDQGSAIAVSNTGVYVTGYFTSTTSTTIAGQALAGQGSSDMFVAKYSDTSTGTTTATSSFANGWATSGTSTSGDFGYGLAVSGRQVYTAGVVGSSATFGSITFGNTVSGSNNFLGRLTDAEPLPVQLVAFTATAAGPAAVALTWVTASEKNSARFDVERSPDGVAFRKVGEVAAAGTTAATHHYAFLDATLSNAPAYQLTYYYRLRQVDFDGTATYSPVRSVALGGAAVAGLSLYPNPATTAAILTGAAPGALVQVLDALGRTVATATADATGTAALVLPMGRAAGVYVVRAGAQALRLAVE